MKLLYTVKEVSEIIKCNTSDTYKLIKSGKLSALKLGSLKIRHESLVKFLEQLEQEHMVEKNYVREEVC